MILVPSICPDTSYYYVASEKVLLGAACEWASADLGRIGVY